MPRPKKEGLDYFPLDTTFDQKMDAFLSIYEKDGFVWMIQFWREAYKSPVGIVQLRGIFGEVLAKKAWITIEKQQIMLKSAIGLKLLEETEEGITSNGIQKRISSVSNDREKALIRYFKSKERKGNKSKVKKSRVKDFGDTSEKYSEVPLWKQNTKEGFQEYLKIAEPEFDKLRNDYNFIADKKRFYPKINIQKSIDKMWEEYWGTEAGWEKRRKSSTTDLNWKRTIENGMSMPLNQVKIPYGEPDPEIVAIKARGIEI